MTRRPNEPDNATDRAAQLARHAQQAAQVRALATHPDVVALRIERVGTQVDALLWTGITLGLAFTTVNVQRFAAAGAPPFTTLWWAAWLLDPMVSLVLLAVIRAEQITSRQGLRPSTWARVTKWTTFTTYPTQKRADAAVRHQRGRHRTPTGGPRLTT